MQGLEISFHKNRITGIILAFVYYFLYTINFYVFLQKFYFEDSSKNRRMNSEDSRKNAICGVSSRNYVILKLYLWTTTSSPRNSFWIILQKFDLGIHPKIPFGDSSLFKITPYTILGDSTGNSIRGFSQKLKLLEIDQGIHAYMHITPEIPPKNSDWGFLQKYVW